MDHENQWSQGMLTRIKLTNFVSYDTIEYHLGPKLNIILDPNGTEKSTLLYALVIGLGGEPSIIGRSPNVADCVRRNCNFAVIELELFNPNGGNYTIKRKITSNANSSWFINNQLVSLAQIDELKQKLHIKLENVCQMLPQDRVQDLAKLNKKELLEATQKSDENEITKGLDEIEGKLLSLHNQRSVICLKQQEFNRKVSSVLQEKKDLENKYNQAKNTHENKLNLLKQNDEYVAYKWLEGNRHLFQKHVYGPMFMELNVTDPTKAKYFEQIIPYIDLVAFVCEDKNDMTKLLSILRGQMNLKINAIHSAPPQGDIRKQYTPEILIRHLKKYGFTTYLRLCLEGPPAILKYLCELHKVHNVPIGTEKVEDNLDKIPKKLTKYFSADRFFHSFVSKYSGLTTQAITEIEDAKLLSYTVDHELIASLEASLEKLENRLKNFNVQVAQAESSMKKIEVTINQLEQQKRDLNKNCEYIQATQIRHRMMKEQELKQDSENRLDVEEEINRFKKN